MSCQICLVTEKDKYGSDKWIARWLLGGCVLIMLMVVVGGITRLTHSGLSMVRWNLFGSLPPSDETKWQTLFGQYQQSPEFRLINYNFTLNDFKNIFWWEFIHRLIGRTIGIVFIVPFLWFLIRKKLTRPLLRKIGLLFLLGLTQGFVGWFMVKSGLDRAPHVSHYFLAMHLFMAFTTFALTFWFALGIRQSRERTVQVTSRIAFWLRVQLVLIAVQVVYGGFVAGLRAGLLFPQFPLMDGKLIPTDAYAMHPWWRNVLENGAGVQFIHRTLAWLIVTNTIVLLYTAYKTKVTLAIQKKVNLMAAAVGIQFALGITTLLLQVPVAVASMHQVSAFILLATTVYLWHALHIKSEIHDGISHHADSRYPGEENKPESDSHEMPGFIHERNYVAHTQSKEQPSKAEKKKHVRTVKDAKQEQAKSLKNDLEYVIA